MFVCVGAVNECERPKFLLSYLDVVNERRHVLFMDLFPINLNLSLTMTLILNLNEI